MPPTSFWLLNTPTVMTPSVDQFFDVGIALDHLVVHDLPRDDVLGVDDRALAGDGDRLLEAPTRSSALTLAVKAADNSMPSRLTVVKPTRVK